MKKSLLIVSALMALSMAFVGCKGGSSDPKLPETPEDVVVTPIKCDMSVAAWGWGYSSSVENDDDGNIVITLSGDYGAGSFGYEPVKDLSGYKTLEVEIASVTADDPWYQVIVQTDDEHKVMKDSYGKNANTVSVDLTIGSLDITSVKQVSVQGKKAGDVIVVKSVTIK